jgi:hypothetical protein
VLILFKGAHAGIDIPEYDPKVNQDCLFSDTFLKLNKEKLLFDETNSQDAGKMLTMTKILKVRYPQYREQIK